MHRVDRYRNSLKDDFVVADSDMLVQYDPVFFLEKLLLIQLFADNDRQRGFAEFIPMPGDVHPHSRWTRTCKKGLL